MANYQTPGVYIEEIPKLPPSIAQVQTAIPAFIGFTEKAQELAPNDLNKKPVKIGSLVEYELYFGYGPTPEVTGINIDAGNNFLSASVQNNYHLYDSLQLFYANGGGDCYIVSIGTYGLATPSDTLFIEGIQQLEKEDEPTLLLFPDAATLPDTELANVQQAALAQCDDLKDRFAILDVQKNDPKGISFRNRIGINFLSYGAAYSPWLKVSLPKTVRYTDITNIRRAGIDTSLSGLTSDPEIQNRISETENAYQDKKRIEDQTRLLAPPNGILNNRFIALENAFIASNTNTSFRNIIEFFYTIGQTVNGYVNGGTPLSYQKLRADLTISIASNFDPVLAQVRMIETEAADKLTDSYTEYDISALPDVTWPELHATADASDVIGSEATTEAAKRTLLVNALKGIFNNLSSSYYSLIVTASANYAKTLDESLALAFPVYQSILTGIRKSLTSIPPSGAVAGVYALTDRTRGVWKAPANISLSNIIAPEVIFSKSELDALNIDAVAGKSVNAIRPFFGKGTLIFGARTLAGNNNEWRYISVRRFFNMVEESTKKATEQFVFEPNDANTWIKVQGMIDNFLNTLWRQGALQGAKPEHAYYVSVGLGKTMTALDILEGRMIVEIGMAVVRPAEFIILRFSHKLAES